MNVSNDFTTEQRTALMAQTLSSLEETVRRLEQEMTSLRQVAQESYSMGSVMQTASLINKEEEKVVPQTNHVFRQLEEQRDEIVTLKRQMEALHTRSVGQLSVNERVGGMYLNAYEGMATLANAARDEAEQFVGTLNNHTQKAQQSADDIIRQMESVRTNLETAVTKLMQDSNQVYTGLDESVACLKSLSHTLQRTNQIANAFDSDISAEIEAFEKYASQLSTPRPAMSRSAPPSMPSDEDVLMPNSPLPMAGNQTERPAAEQPAVLEPLSQTESDQGALSTDMPHYPKVNSEEQDYQEQEERIERTEHKDNEEPDGGCRYVSLIEQERQKIRQQQLAHMPVPQQEAAAQEPTGSVSEINQEPQPDASQTAAAPPPAEQAALQEQAASIAFPARKRVNVKELLDKYSNLK